MTNTAQRASTAHPHSDKNTGNEKTMEKEEKKEEKGGKVEQEKTIGQENGQK